MMITNILFILLCPIVLYCIGCGYSHNNNQSSTAAENNKYIDTFDGELLQAGKAAEGDHFFGIAEPSKMTEVIPSLYFLETHFQTRTETLGRIEETGVFVFHRELDRLSYDVYAIETGWKIKTINVDQILRREYPGFQLTASFVFDRTVSYQGKPFVIITLEPQPEVFEDGVADEIKLVYLDIETEEVFARDYSRQKWDDERKANSPMQPDYYIVKDSDFLKFNGLDDVTIGYLKYWEGVAYVFLPVHSLPEENERLYTMFPQLKAIAEEARKQEWDNEKDIPYVYINIVDFPTPEEMMRLVMPDDQEISFEGWKISGSVSIDGFSHPVNSFEEYKALQGSMGTFLDDSLIYPIFRSDE